MKAMSTYNKNKIGIVTYVRTDNYGAELQGYALQHKLHLLGYEAEVLDIDKIEIDKKTFREMAIKAIAKRLKSNPIIGFYDVIKLIIQFTKRRKNFGQYEFERKKDRENAFYDFWMNYIIHTDHIPLNELYDNPPKFNSFIAGSDQIWNYTRTSYLDPYFLTFAPQEAQKISYAASFSVKQIPSKRRNQYKDLINNIHSISVREEDGIRIVKDLTNRDAHWVLDPTLLLDKQEWLKIKNDRINFDKPYLLVYSLNSSDGFWKIVYRYAKRHDLLIVNLRHDFKDNDIPKNQVDVFDAGPREFIHLMSKAKLIVTNSFHGTIFAINFNIPFICVLNRVSETNSRIQSILNLLQLSDRCQYDNELNSEIPLSLDFKRSNDILEKSKIKSVKFLINSLEDASVM